jgi:hypothetical protein
MADKTAFLSWKRTPIWVMACVAILMSIPAVAQNTKGDKPTSSTSPASSKKKLFGTKNKGVGSRVSSNRDKRSRRADRISNKPLPSAPVRTSPPRGGDRAYTKTVSGRPITSPRSSTKRITRVYPQRGPFVNNPSPKPGKSKAPTKRLPSAVTRFKTPSGNDKAWPQGKTVSGRVLTSRTAPTRKPKVYPQKGPYIHNPSVKPKRPDASPRNKPLYQARQLSMSKAASQARSMGVRGAGFKTITARFITGPKRNVYWGKERKKWEEAYTKDITGRRLRTRDMRSPRMGLVSADTLPFARRTPRSVKRRPSQPLGGYQSATRTGRAWKGDISGNRIRRNPNRGTAEQTGKFFMPRKLSVSGKVRANGQFIHERPAVAGRPSPKISSKKLPAKAPGIGAVAYAGFSRRASAMKKPKGAGGSVTASLKKDRRPLPSKGVSPSALRVTRYAGAMKGKRPLKGGGSLGVTGWNNNRNPVTVRKAGAGTIQAAQFKGRQRGIAGSTQFGRMGGGFTGHIKTRRPEKGGGSVSGKLWNNRNQPLTVQEGAKSGRAAGSFQGTIKTRRPDKGGGSVSGKLWNNNNQPIDVRTGGKGTQMAANYQGKTKYRKPPETAGELATSTGKIKGVLPGLEMSQVGLNYTGDRKQPKFVQNPKAFKESLRKDKHPDGIKLNVPILSQTKRSVNAAHYVRVMKQDWDYKKAPNSAKGALKVREPGRAQPHIGDLQVNVKMKKHMGKELHPDARFAHSQHNNVKEERTFLTNIKLAWAKLFKKSDTQPRGLKQKNPKPRYDPAEVGIWYK